MSYPAAVVAGVGVGSAVAAVVLTCVIGSIVGRHLKRRGAFKPPREPPNPDIGSGALACQQLARDNLDCLPGWAVGELKISHRFLLDKIHFIASKFDLGDSALQNFDVHAWAALAGGDPAYWASMTSLSLRRRQDLVRHFLARFLYQRMIPESDPSITLLPPDMLRTYQQMMRQPDEKICGGTTQHRSVYRTAIHIRHYWRALTVHFTSEVVIYNLSMHFLRKNLTHFPESDPRRLNHVAAEEVLMRLFGPLRNPEIDKTDDHMRRHFQKLLVVAADVALATFARPQPFTFIWSADQAGHELPPTPQLPLPSDKDDEDTTHDVLWPVLFGIKMMRLVPGEELERPQDEMDEQCVSVFVPPLDSGSRKRREERIEAKMAQWVANNGYNMANLPHEAWVQRGYIAAEENLD